MGVRPIIAAKIDDNERLSRDKKFMLKFANHNNYDVKEGLECVAVNLKEKSSCCKEWDLSGRRRRGDVPLQGGHRRRGRTTFESVDRWLQELGTHSDTTIARILVGNKCDLESIRAVSVEEGKNLAEAEGLFFIETSALDSTNVKTAFEIVIKEIYANLSRRVLNSDSSKPELSQNRVSLVSNGTDDQKKAAGKFSCC
ncbi:ras-related protein RABA5c-like [Asparagus officinalis]|uniref:ras-related protein RABA5c-like n=1 Tax=Asparagus officinalis TaxID=4686 RepID=UPI00098DF973|nr:ras-related protein RABA5c-like [Asparagus officinalis]